MLRTRYMTLVSLMVTAWLVPPATAQDRVSETVHNLSASGPGDIRAHGEGQVCLFCHTPHNASPHQNPLWNRGPSTASYQIYQSSTLDAKPGQPTGSSKLCLSCHDGTIALGSVLSRTDKIRMIGGDFMPAGLTNLGTDLSDDHPISFYYTSGLAASDRQLQDPSALGHSIKLDRSGQLQCTSCHDPHHNPYGKFLVASNEYGQLCTSCHVMEGWSASSHRNSGSPVAGAAMGDWPYQTVEQNACRSCHRPHTAGGRERLFIFEEEEDNCLCCHDGSVARTDIRAELDKISAHDPRLYLGVHDPVETAFTMRPHVECADCHNAHAVSAADPGRSYVPIGATMANVPGAASAGGYGAKAQYEYEVCYRCHGDSPAPIARRVSRQVDQPNLRLQFSPLSPSFHPLVVASPSSDTVSLKPGLPPGSMIRCTDCHNNDTGPGAGGGGPDGPHGSIYDHLLERNYTTRDDTPESQFEYALCYKCHERSSILANRSFEQHSRHIRDEDTPCSACHDPHGVGSIGAGGSDHTHLINFDTTIARPDSQTGRLEFRDEGRMAGNCTLTCHGSVHRERSYGN